jgi:hypothetical protein
MLDDTTRQRLAGTLQQRLHTVDSGWFGRLDDALDGPPTPAIDEIFESASNQLAQLAVELLDDPRVRISSEGCANRSLWTRRP